MRCYGYGMFQVTEGRTKFVVDVGVRTCDCNVWQIDGIPCKHAVRAIRFMNQKPEDWVHECYSLEKFRATYSHSIASIKDPIFWPPMDNLPLLSPPPVPKKRGRPAKKRRRSHDEPTRVKRSRTITCSLCKSLHHNHTTCPLKGPRDPCKRKMKGGDKRPIGKPRKDKSKAVASTLTSVVTQSVTQSAATTKKRKTISVGPEGVDVRRSPRVNQGSTQVCTQSSQAASKEPRRSPRSKKTLASTY